MGLSREGEVRLYQVAILVGFLILLEVTVRREMVGVITLSSPTAIAGMLFELLVEGELTEDIVATGISLASAFLAALVTGFLMGIVLWQLPLLQRILDPYLIAYYALPIFVFYPLFIVIFGISLMPIIIIAYAMSVIVIVLNTANGFNSVDDIYVKVGRSHNLTTRQMITNVYFPAAVPHIFTGLKLGFLYALIGVIASEFIVASKGLGYLVSQHYRTFATTEMYAVITLVIVLSVTINLVLTRIERRLHTRVSH